MLRCVSIMVAGAVVAAGVSSAVAADASGPFMLQRIARTAAPGLHIRLVDAGGAAVYPVEVVVEYESGAPDRGSASEDGLTLAAADGRKVRAVMVGKQRFAVDAARSNVIIFRR